MKILVVYYSRTGKTKKTAEEISRNLKSDLDEIIDEKQRKGIFGYIFGGRDAFLKKPTKISFNKDPEKYDLIVLGSPVWAGTFAPAIRVYLEKNKEILNKKKLAFFTTQGSNQEQKAFKDFEEILSKKIKNKMFISGKDFYDKTDKDKVRIFCSELK